MAMTPEGKVKKKIVEQLKELGCYYFFPATGGYGKSGVPDIVGCYNGKFFGIECKAGKNTPTALQQMNLKITRRTQMGNEKSESKVRGEMAGEWDRLREEIPAIESTSVEDFVAEAVKQGYVLAEAIKEAKPAVENSIDGAMARSHYWANSKKEDDAINPDHYKSGLIECIEAIEESMTTIAFAGYLKGNCMKYLWRYETKHSDDPLQDLKKAEWYLSRLIELVGEDYE